VPRIMHNDVHAIIDTASWKQPPVFDWLQATGNIATAEMRRTFNCGVGMVIVVDAAMADAALELLAAAGESAWRIGEIAAGRGPVRYV